MNTLTISEKTETESSVSRNGGPEVDTGDRQQERKEVQWVLGLLVGILVLRDSGVYPRYVLQAAKNNNMLTHHVDREGWIGLLLESIQKIHASCVYLLNAMTSVSCIAFAVQNGQFLEKNEYQSCKGFCLFYWRCCNE